MGHKLPKALTDREASCQLAGLLERDDASFGGSKPGKHSREARRGFIFLARCRLGEILSMGQTPCRIMFNKLNRMFESLNNNPEKEV
jgi:hypothetical protein